LEKRVDVAYVNIWGNLVGAVSWNTEKEYATFEFDQKFLNMGIDLSPIVMPLSEAIKRKQPSFEFRNLPKNTFRGLPGLLSDSLPDKFGNSIIDSYRSIVKDITDVISTWLKIAKELDIKKSYIDEIRSVHRLSIVKNSSISFSM
jgi:hypothetical protein